MTNMNKVIETVNEIKATKKQIAELNKAVTAKMHSICKQYYDRHRS